MPAHSRGGPLTTDRPTAESHGEKLDDHGTPSLRHDGYDARMRALDDEFVRRSFRRSWEPEVRRLRRLGRAS